MKRRAWTCLHPASAPRSTDSSDDEADAPRKLVLADTSDPGDAAGCSTTSPPIAVSNPSQDTVTATGESPTSPASPPPGGIAAIGHDAEPAAQTPAAEAALVEEAVAMEGPDDLTAEGTAPPHHPLLPSSRAPHLPLPPTNPRRKKHKKKTAPCLDDGHQQGPARCAVYVKRELLQAEVPVADLPIAWGGSSCFAGTSTLITLPGVVAALTHGGREVRDVLQQLGLVILNTGADTFVRRGRQATSTAIDLSVATEGCRYSWSPLPDTWGVGPPAHPAVPPSEARPPRDREYRVVDWRVYRQLFQQDIGDKDLLQLVADNARAATVVTKAQQGQPVPDMQHLALRAARRRAERQALKKVQPELWTVFRRVDAVCRRHARGRRNQGWVSVCVSIDSSRDGTRAWRLLKCLLTVPRAFNQVLSLAVHLTIHAADLAEQLADQFATRDVAQLPAAPPPAALPCPASCHHPGWVARLIREKNPELTVREEPRLTSRDGVRLKPDLVVESSDQVLVIDLAVVWDANEGVLKDKAKEKAAKYAVLRDRFDAGDGELPQGPDPNSRLGNSSDFTQGLVIDDPLNPDIGRTTREPWGISDRKLSPTLAGGREQEFLGCSTASAPHPTSSHAGRDDGRGNVALEEGRTEEDTELGTEMRHPATAVSVQPVVLPRPSGILGSLQDSPLERPGPSAVKEDVDQTVNSLHNSTDGATALMMNSLPFGAVDTQLSADTDCEADGRVRSRAVPAASAYCQWSEPQMRILAQAELSLPAGEHFINQALAAVHRQAPSLPL
ncbi:hypothetical protein MTO96_040419 [Rhipicephalus appendiculatus]